MPAGAYITLGVVVGDNIMQAGVLLVELYVSQTKPVGTMVTLIGLRGVARFVHSYSDGGFHSII